MWTFIKSLFGSKKAEQVQEAPYKVEAPVAETPVATAPVAEAPAPAPAPVVETPVAPAPVAEKKPAAKKSDSKNTGPYPFPTSAPAQKAPKAPKAKPVKAEVAGTKKKQQKKST
jgi:hypothetical protein